MTGYPLGHDTEPDLRAIERLLADATPAPWRLYGPEIIAADGATFCGRMNLGAHDSALVVILRNAAPALLEMLATLREERDDARAAAHAALDAWGAHAKCCHGGPEYERLRALAGPRCPKCCAVNAVPGQCMICGAIYAPLAEGP